MMPALLAHSLRVVLRALPLFLTSFVGLWSLATTAAAASPAACGFCYALQAYGQRLIVPLESTEVVLDIKPGLIEAEVNQTFTNHTSTALEAIYLYPLPHDATITQLELRYPDHVVTSQVREKKQAREDYEAAKIAGKKAALLEQHDPTLFSTAVANFLPGETVHVVFRFIQPLALSADAVEVRFPMVTASKYFPASTPVGSADASAPTPPQVDASAVSSNHVYAFDISVHGFPVRSIQSSSHRIQTTRETPDGYRVALAEEVTIPDRDLVLRIETEPTARPEPTVVTQHTAEGNFALLTLFPHLKKTASAHAQEGYDFVFLIDHSGSMQGTRIESARLGLEAALTSLSPQDRFQVVIFDSQYSFYKDTWTPVNGSTLAAAIQYVRQIQANSGTEMQPALDACFDFIQRNESPRQPVIVFLTDGDVGNEKTLLQLVEKRTNRTRLFAFGIGSEPNAFLLEKMAEAGHGQARFIHDDASVARELAHFFGTLESPVLSEVKITLLDTQGAPVNGTIFPRELPDVFVERPIQAFFWTAGPPPTALRLEAKEDGSPVRTVVALSPTPVRGDGLEKQFGRLWYDDLEKERRRASTPEQRTSIEEKMREVGLRFQLVTEFTSRVAVEQRVSRDPSAPLNSQLVPQYRAADHGSVPVKSDEDFVVLSPFSVRESEEQGYCTASSLTGSRLNGSLHDSASALSLVLPRRLLDDVGVTKLEDVVPFTLQPEHSPGIARAIGDPGLLDGLPIASPVDPATVSQIELSSGGSATSSIQQRRAGEPNRSALTLRAGDEGLATASLLSAFTLGHRDRIPVLAIFSYAQFPEAQTSLLLSVRQDFGDDRLYLSLQGRELNGYGRTRLGEVSFEHKFNNDLTLETTLAWHRLVREDPEQFARGSTSGSYEGLGFFNLDLLTAQTRRLADTVARVQLAGHSSIAAIPHTWVLRGSWHDEKSDWVTPLSALTLAPHRVVSSLDFDDQARFLRERLSLQISLGASLHRTSGETEEHRTTRHASVGLAWKFAEELHAFFNLADEASLPWVPSGEIVSSLPSPARISLPIEHRQGGQAGLRIEAFNGRLHGEVALFHQQVHNSSFRDWAWERDHAGLGAEILSGNVTRLPFGYGVASRWKREGVLGSLSFTPVPAITATASWYDDWSDQGPYRGGNRRASLLARYTFQRGGLKNLATGFAASARNTLTFDDGYKIEGGVRWDYFAAYRWRWLPGRWTSAQVNLINLTRCPWQPTRFSKDHGRQVLLSLSQEF